jgi:hypothetical protein
VKKSEHKQVVSHKSQPMKDWKRTIGIFTGDAGMKQLFEEALRIRAQDRRQARLRSNHKRKA